MAQVLSMLVVSLCKPVIHKFKLLAGVKPEYYKSMGETTKRGDQILKFQWGSKRGRGMQFSTHLVGEGGGDLEGNCSFELFQKLHS